jgi:hypothetical protein
MMVRKAPTLGLCILLGLPLQTLRAQEPSDTPAPAEADSTVQTDPPGSRFRSTGPVANPPVDESQWPNPTITMFKSMLVPGWGQITNERYIKAAFAIGLEAWFLTGTLVNWSKANKALDRFRADPGDIQAFNDYQFYWGNRSDFIWLLGLTVFVSMFDAYVDAHLIPYQEDTIPGVEPPKGIRLIIDF